jgi:hypothetical protein
MSFRRAREDAMAIQMPFKKESTVPTPSEVGSTASGMLPDDVLVPCGIRSFRMTADAASTVRAMVAAAKAAGIELDATGTYRRYDDQLSLFLSRYEPCTEVEYAVALVLKRGRKWDAAPGLGHSSKFWRKKLIDGKVPADAATPGASKHGLGVSIDWARHNPKQPSKPHDLDAPALRWLADNGPGFGMWNTNQSENWHFCHFGPGVTPAVRAFEVGAGLNPNRLGGGGVAVAPIDLSGVAAGIARARSHLLFLDNPEGNDPEAVRWLRIQLNAKLHMTGTPFQLDEESPVFDADLKSFLVVFQEQIHQFVEGISGGAEVFEVDGRVGPDTWFWLFA